MINREKLEDYFYLGTFLIAMLFALLSVLRYISLLKNLFASGSPINTRTYSRHFTAFQFLRYAFI